MKFSKRELPPNPIRKNYDYGQIPNFVDRLKMVNEEREKREEKLSSILKGHEMLKISERDEPQFIMTIGIPGSGKSTWIGAQEEDENTIVVSPDNIREEITGDISDQSQNGKVWFIAKERVVEGLNAGKNVILDATNVDGKNRRRFLKGLPSGIALKAKIFNVDPEEAKRRIKEQIDKGENRANVPPHAIDNMQAKFERSTPEQLREEGFDIL